MTEPEREPLRVEVRWGDWDLDRDGCPMRSVVEGDSYPDVYLCGHPESPVGYCEKGSCPLRIRHVLVVLGDEKGPAQR